MALNKVIRRHKEGNHSKKCRIYSFPWACNICKYSLDPFLSESDRTLYLHGSELRR